MDYKTHKENKNMMRNIEKSGKKDNRNHQNSENTTRGYILKFIKLNSSERRNVSWI